MPNISRVRAVFEGFPGAPGVSTFYCLDPVAFVPRLRAWLQNYAGLLPSGVTITVQPTGDIIDSVTGVLGATWTTAVVLPVTGTATGTWAAPVGMAVNWLTGTVLDGRRLRGRTFMVPLASTAFDLTGSLEATVLTSFRDAATVFVADMANNFVVWHRPRVASLLGPARAGGHAIVTSSTIADKAAVLRSRRD